MDRQTDGPSRQTLTHYMPQTGMTLTGFYLDHSRDKVDREHCFVAPTVRAVSVNQMYALSKPLHWTLAVLGQLQN